MLIFGVVKVPKPKPTEDEGELNDKSETEVLLPQTLVRIPIEKQEEPEDSHNGSGTRDEA